MKCLFNKKWQPPALYLKFCPYVNIAEIQHVSSDEETILPESPTRVGIKSELALSSDEETDLPQAQQMVLCLVVTTSFELY